MDVLEKVDLVERSPTQEVVTRDELVELFKTNQSPKHYIGLEISGFLHLGSLISTGFKINDFASAGIDCTIFLADWHTLINDKLGGNPDVISKVSEYYRDAFRLVCPEARIVMGSDLYRENPGYWSEFVEITRHMSLARTMRTLTIMGRSEDDKKIGLAKLLYPPMQAADIHALDVDIVHAGMDQRKIHMLAREVFPKVKWKVPVAIHHKLLPGLSRPAADSQPGKMSKSDSNSGIFMHDTDDAIRKKIGKAWCEEGAVQDNPVLEIARTMIFRGSGGMNVERPEKFGGNISYSEYARLEKDYAQKRLHPGDLKQAVGECLVDVIAPIRDKLRLDGDIDAAIKKSC
ncbi:MAG: tyrosine--tRNA ligase [Nitrosopumilus sp. H13]|nr:MAG: tyrosine--tRNA ligase [Nitrosopumilus sp. H13]